MTAARLLWLAAGSPTLTTTGDPPEWSEPHEGTCWWCGLPASGLCRRVDKLPSTFPPQPQPARPDASHLCPACSWSLSDRVALPPARAAEQAEKRLTDGGRMQLGRGRRLVLRLADGRIGLWSCGPNATAEKPWMSARKALRESPEDVGVCAHEGAVPVDDLDLPAEAKFRNYHHFGSRSRGWHPWTATHRHLIRDWLLDPPEDPWVGTIGDGQKHTVIYGVVSPGRPVAYDGTLWGRRADPVQQVYVEGTVVHYRPAELGAQLEAVEALIRAGAGDEEVSTGRYRHRGGPEWLITYRRCEPIVSAVRGGPVMGLLLYLRRNRKELENG